MPYTKFHDEWKNKPDTSTPITAEALEHIEAGIAAATENAEDTDSVTAANITDATTVGRNVLKAADAGAARSAIGAGTGDGNSNLALGTTATTAAKGDHTHTAADVTDLGDAATLDVGTAAGTVAAGNHTHTQYVSTTRTVNGKPLSANVTLTGADAALTGYAIGTVAEAAVAPTDTVNAAMAKLEKRIADLEAAAP